LISRFPDGPAFEEYLSSLGMFHMRLGMGRMRTAQIRLKLTKPAPRLAQIVGTNGKGSTAYFLSQIAQAHGLKTGLFTSPHFLSFRERIRINARCVRPDQVLDWANHIQEHVWDLDLTYFELLTLIAVYGFQRECLDLAVLEAGLGGANDATTAWTPDVLLCTPIGKDHEHVIGPDLEHIARDKAGAIKANATVITAHQAPQVMLLLQREAERKNARLVSVAARLAAHPEMNAFMPGLSGEHQIGNARLALAGWLEICAKNHWEVDMQACREGVSASSWPGRLQRIAGPPRIILDGAHNASALQALTQALKKPDVQPHALVFTCMRDKDLESMAPWVRQLTSGPIFVPELPTYERARSALETAASLGERARPVAGVAEALQTAAQTGSPVLVCGSLYLLAEVYALHPEWLAPWPGISREIEP